MFDSAISQPRIDTLHPRKRDECREIIEALEANTGILIRVSHGFRTWDEQQAIYNQGRTTPGKIVTWAKPGYSWHNYGFAIDFCLLRPTGDGHIMYSWDTTADDDKDGEADWMQIVRGFEGYGWEAGIRWPKNPDGDHFQFTYNLSIEQAHSLYVAGARDAQGYLTDLPKD